MNTNNNDHIMKGGEVIASGGFGCIFDPPLKCADPDSSLKSNNITKLMTEKHAKDEYAIIQNFNHLLNVIPNYRDFFLVDGFSLCHPAHLNEQDLKGYNKKCKALKKKNITEKNINSSLDKLLAINMPYGGTNVEDFVYDNFTGPNMVRLNNTLIDLLLNGIIPMNNLSVYHCDIKDTNILVEYTETTMFTRLIDWGLSFKHESEKGLPRKLYRRPFQFNVPFSSVLFNNELTKMYNEFLKDCNNEKPTYFQIREFVINYIFVWNEIRGSGHLEAINEIITKFTERKLIDVERKKVKHHVIEYEFTYYYIVEYLTKVLDKYTNNGKLDILVYFNDVFLKNLDIWGFVMVYISIFERIYDKYPVLTPNQKAITDKLKHIIVHYLYEDPTSPIDTTGLVKELEDLNPLLNEGGITGGGIQWSSMTKKHRTKLRKKGKHTKRGRKTRRV